VLALKSSGVLEQSCKPEIMDKIVAQRLWVDHSAIKEVKRRLIEAGLISDDWHPVAWEKRQRPSDHDPSNAERQRRSRERKKAEKSGNALRNGNSNGTVTPLDKIRVEEKKDIAHPDGCATAKTAKPKKPQTANRFDEFWDAYPNRKGKKRALQTWKAKGFDEIADTLIADVKARIINDPQWADPQYIPHGSTYVNSECWLDDIAPKPNGTAQPQPAKLPKRPDPGDEPAWAQIVARYDVPGDVIAARSYDAIWKYVTQQHGGQA
jgi:hypothetical protein